MSFRGKKNVYICTRCGQGFVSLDVDDGVTPFISPCLQCGEMAYSLCYNIPQVVMAQFAHAVEWYKPDAEELATSSTSTRKHVERGGLLPRPARPIDHGKRKMRH